MVDGVRLDTGAESVLARRPEAVTLIDELGLGTVRVHPTTAKPALLVGGEPRSVPPSVLGVPIELERLRGQLMAGGTVTTQDRDARAGLLLEGAVRLHADLGQVLGSWSRSPRQALARLHVLAAGDLVDDPDRLGRPIRGSP